MTQNNNSSAFLPGTKDVHRVWWTALPVLPPSRHDRFYPVLKRLWHDHTMNVVKSVAGTHEVRSGRCIYVAGREDHMSATLFHAFSAFSLPAVERILTLWKVPYEGLLDAHWSYSFEEEYERGKRILDIVLMWRDRMGDGVLVIEAKRKDGRLEDKDRNARDRYLDVPSVRRFGSRRHFGFLFDSNRKQHFELARQINVAAVSWQDLAKAQLDLAERTIADAQTRSVVQSAVAACYAQENVRGVPAPAIDLISVAPDALRSLPLSPRQRAFVLGTQGFLMAQAGKMPDPPMDWLAKEPSILDAQGGGQSTDARRIALWDLDLLKRVTEEAVKRGATDAALPL